MPTLRLASSERRAAYCASHERVRSLREWLQGHWAVVCSHPDDFAPPRGTPEGFVTCIAEGLRTERVKMIGFDCTLEPPPASWLDHAVNDDSIVVLDGECATVVDLAEHALAAKLAALTQPFVVIVDDRGRVRTTLKYRYGDRSRTLFDIVELVAILRAGENEIPTSVGMTDGPIGITDGFGGMTDRSMTVTSCRDSFSS